MIIGIVISAGGVLPAFVLCLVHNRSIVWIVEASVGECLFLSYGNTPFLFVGSCLNGVSCAYSLWTMYSWSAVM